jgi:uncharacterized membrane protein HdeD (DUF308 family)
MFTDPERILFLAIIIAGFLQLAKLFVPLLNGWGGVLANATMTAVGLFVVFRFELTWTTLATYLLIGLAAAGIHGTATKVSDYPSPHENPTPSGTPAQNYRVHVEQ